MIPPAKQLSSLASVPAGACALKSDYRRYSLPPFALPERPCTLPGVVRLVCSRSAGVLQYCGFEAWLPESLGRLLVVNRLDAAKPFEPIRELVEIEVDDRRREQRERLAHDQAAHHCVA